MTRPFFTLLLLLSWCLTAQAQQANDIVGTWFNAEKDGRIQIYKQGESFFGKLVWLKNPTLDGKARSDEKNNDTSLRNRPLLGLVLLKDFKYDEDNVWNQGKVYDPKNGKTYSCKLTLSEKNRLDVRGYIGTPLLGRTTSWTRAE